MMIDTYQIRFRVISNQFNRDTLGTAIAVLSDHGA
jgi:hypothetical protein